MINLKLKIITGFRKDQSITIDAEEAHKAYFLFLNPDKRGIFKNGVALCGQNIQSIEPDYHATLGWNPSHVLTGEDYNEIKNKNLDTRFREALALGKNKAQEIKPPELSTLGSLSLSAT
jgi:hypothetical protein